MAIEGIIFALSIYLVWSLYMPLKTKAVVVGAFFCRILYVPFSLGIYVAQLTPPQHHPPHNRPLAFPQLRSPQYRFDLRQRQSRHPDSSSHALLAHGLHNPLHEAIPSRIRYRPRPHD